MLRFLLLRPIAVIMVLIACLACSVIAYLNLPISLLPNIDVPEISISIRYPNTPAEEIEENILRPIRESMLTINGLKNIESSARQESGIVSLHLEYSTDMDLAFIEVSEKIDRLNSSLPQDLERPQVVKVNTSDIPIVRLQITPVKSEDHLMISKLASSVLKRRLEQVPGVGLVDVNGIRSSTIYVTPDYSVLESLGLTEQNIAQAIESANLEFGSVKVRDGNYQYFLKLSSKLEDPKALETLPIKIPQTTSLVQLKDLAKVSVEEELPSGYHTFNSKDGIVVTIHKQSEARLPELMPHLCEIVDQFHSEYPSVEFELTQDQSTLLTLSINNLTQALIWGGLFAFGVLFLFMGGWREPFVMGIILPVSLILCFSLLYFFNVSLNIISLSGLALGLGMLVDNSIVVIDNIVIKRKSGASLLDSCVTGTYEVVPPLISSALTNLAVFIPLIFISGLAGALFLDQAIAVASILFVSILCTFVFVPLLYLLFYKNRELQIHEDSMLFIKLKNGYHKSFLWVWNHKILCIVVFSVMIPISIVLLFTLPKQGFPEIVRTEAILTLDWNEQIDVASSRKRTIDLLETFKGILQYEAEIGQKDFVLIDDQQTAQQATIYIRFNSSYEKESIISELQTLILSKYPNATVEFRNAPNAFEQLFDTDIPFYEVKFRDPLNKKPIQPNFIDSLKLTNELDNYTIGKGFQTESIVYVNFNFQKIQLYSIDIEALNKKLKLIFGNYLITNLKNYGELIPIKFKGTETNFEIAIHEHDITSTTGKSYPIKEFIETSYVKSNKNITADAGGIYQSISTDTTIAHNLILSHWAKISNSKGLTTELAGNWYDNKSNIQQITVVLIISFVLMYFIITAEFESFTMPLIVMLSIPIGLGGSLLLLWLTGGSINIMSGIGLVVVLGILDNDAILKIDRINALNQTMPLKQAIEQAGLDRLKPIVMNTCTNVLAVTPIVFSSGLGADLQRPVAITTIGGLVIATFTALYFVPLVYWFFNRGREKKL